MKKELLSLGVVLASATPTINAEATAISAPETMKLGNQKLHLSAAAQIKINKQIKRLTQNPEYYGLYLQRAALYFPHIEKILADSGIPAEFKYLVLQESALEPNAVSKSAAVGYWQFKKGTATDFTLRVDGLIDERKNIVAATQAAATYFRKSQEKFENWTYALLSYNLGIKGTETKYSSLLKNKSGHVYINEKTHGYILRFLAHCLAFQNAEVNDKSAHTLIPFSTRGFKVSKIAKELGIKAQDIKAHNHWLKTDQIPNDRDYVVLVPVLKSKRTESIIKLSLLTGYESNPYDKKRFKGILKTKAAKNKRDSVVINGDKNKFPRVESMAPIATASGDAILVGRVNGLKAVLAHDNRLLSALAADLKLDLKKLLAYNDLKADETTQRGTVYYLEPKRKFAATPVHTLLKGESLWQVSQTFGITMASLRNFNGFAANTVPQEGLMLWIQAKKPAKVQHQINPDPDDAPESMVDFDWDGELIKEVKKVDENTTTTESTDTVVSTSEEESLGVSQEAASEDQNADEDKSLVYYKVKQGDTIFGIAQNLNISVEDIRLWNNMSSYEIVAGSKLVVGRRTSEAERLEKATKASNDAILVGEYLIYTTQESELIADIANRFGVTTEQIKKWNEFPAEMADPQTRLIVGKPTQEPVLESDVQNSSEVLTNKVVESSVGNVEAPKESTSSPAETKKLLPDTHRIGSSQTLYAVSKLYDIPVSNLVAWNALTDAGVREGQVIKLKQPEGFVAAALTPPTDGVHVVVEGETLYSIARKYNVTVSNIRKWNGVEGQGIRVGQKLFVQEPLGGTQATVSEKAKDPNFHIVEEGETLRSVAQKYNLLLVQLAGWNKLDTSYVLKLDEKLFVVDPISVSKNDTQKDPKEDENKGTPSKTGNTGTLVFHLVRSEETIFKIAKMYGVTTDQIRAWNGLSGDDLKSGTKVKIYAQILPEKGQNNGSADANDSQAVPKFVYFRAGGNLYKLCAKYGLNLSDVQMWNGFKTDQLINVGDIVYLTEAAAIEAGKYNPNEVKAPDGSEHPDGIPNFVYFRAGGNLYKLCQKYGLNLSDVQDWNGFSNDQVIDVGQIVYLRKEAAEAAKNAAKGNEANAALEVPDFVYFREGGNLYKLCKKYSLNLSDVQEWNGFAPDEIVKVGQIVYLKEAAAIAARNKKTDNASAKNTQSKEEVLGSSKDKAQNAAVLEVPDFVQFRAGGSLYGLCKKYGLNVSEVLDWNEFPQDYVIKVGETVYLKKDVAEKAKGKKQEVVEVPDFVQFRSGGSLYGLCKKYGLNVSDVQDWNGFAPNYVIKVGETVYLKKDVAEKAKGKKQEVVEVPEFVQFRAGGSLYGLCKKYGLNMSEVLDWNGLAPDYVIKVGEKIYLKKEAAEKAKVKSSQKSSDGKAYHTVKEGETFYTIVEKYNLKPADLAAWNNLPANKREVLPGTKLIVGGMPSSTGASSPDPDSISPDDSSSDANSDTQDGASNSNLNETKAKTTKMTYTVLEGETLFGVARKHGVTTNEIIEWNSLSSRTLDEGQTIVIMQ